MLALRRRTKWSLLDYYLPYVFALMWLLISLIPSPINDYLSQPIDLVFTLGVLPIVLAFIWLRRREFDQEYRRLRQYHLLQDVDLDSGGLRVETSQGVSNSSWDVYSRFAEDQRSFVLFIKNNEHTFFPIVKDHLTIPQTDELRALLGSRLPMA